ncbi:MAG: lyase family protein, partial [Synechococcaceae cyanobacterium]|nr:lyase family protein [Synechococcaceae cyanobacterium]
ERNIKRLKRLQKAVSVGQISGAMGNYANTEPQIEERACELLGLRPDPASTQVISRDRHADYVQTLALVGTALENMALWHERDISHSSVERMMLPDCSVTLHFMLREMTEVVKGLGVYPENMARNLNVYGGVVFSQRVLLALVESGMSREDAYRVVQRNAHSAWNTAGGDFRANLEGDPEVSSRLTPEQLQACFATDLHQAHLAVIWQRLGI